MGLLKGFQPYLDPFLLMISTSYFLLSSFLSPQLFVLNFEVFQYSLKEEMAMKGREEKEHVNLMNIFCDLIKSRDIVTR